MTHTNDLTTGSPVRLLTSLAMPILIGSLVQQIYTLADTFILGKYVSTEALTAVSCTSWIYWLIVGIFTGFTQGFSILISQHFGSSNITKMHKSISMSLLLSVLLTICITIICLPMIRPLLTLLHTPDNVIAMSERYLFIVTAGIFITMAYNLLSSILRAVGDTKTSLIALITSSLINIILDILFVVYLHNSVTGVAVATLIAQAFSCFICMVSVFRIPELKLNKADWLYDRSMFVALFRLGLPLALQNIVISIGGLIMQGIVNSYGYIFTAAISLTGKVTSLIQQAGVSFSVALGTYVGQNLGAHKMERIKEGVLKCLKINLVLGFLTAISFILIGKPVLTAFLSMNSSTAAANQQIINLAYEYLFIQCIFLFTVYILFTYRAGLLGMGYTFIPMLSGFVELGLRLVSALILPLLIGEKGVFFADGLAWVGAGALLMVSYYVTMKRIPI